MGLLTIGAFAKASRLSPKALRLYDELGLLTPAKIDPANGYRLYEPGQLERARLVAWLRRAGLPLARIRNLCDLEPAAAAEELRAYWARVEAEHAGRRDVVAFLVERLTGEGGSMFEIDVRDRGTRGSGADAADRQAQRHDRPARRVRHGAGGAIRERHVAGAAGDRRSAVPGLPRGDRRRQRRAGRVVPAHPGPSRPGRSAAGSPTSRCGPIPRIGRRTCG
ncbi:MAG TPA: helix-turn-helix domain-containing protein [Nonomuraea sp.]|nr:helix-turn-helix domain-containing protein [Nonomuraea sp.]